MEKHVAGIDKSSKRISGADTQLNRFLNISIERRQVVQNGKEIVVETLRQKEDEKVGVRMAAEQAKTLAEEAAAKVEAAQKEAYEKEKAAKEAKEAVEKAEADAKR